MNVVGVTSDASAPTSSEQAGYISRLTDWLCLAAAPTFAVMALLTGIFSDDAAHMLCSAPDAPPLSGMAMMYWLMSAFHLPAWLKRKLN